MAIDHVVASLSRVPLFAELKPLQISRIARQAERCCFRRGDIITKAGAPGDGAFLILSGEAGAGPAGDRGRHPEPIEPGSLVGELAMFVEHVYGATVVADGRVDCLKLERSMLHEQMRADPDIAERARTRHPRAPDADRRRVARIDRLPHRRQPRSRRAGQPGRPLLAAARMMGARPACGNDGMRNEKRPTPGEELGARSASCA